MDTYKAIRESLKDDIAAAWPGLTKVHFVDPALIQGELPYGWVAREGPLDGVPDEGDTRNFHAFAATFRMGARFANTFGQGADLEDERLRLAQLIFDRVTAENHHADLGYLERITQMLTLEGEVNDQFFEVEILFRCTFELRRADAV